MQGKIRRKLSMAARALDFARTHASTDAGYTTIVTRLEERVARADTLAIQELDGVGGESAAVARRADLRHTMHERLLRHLARVAGLATRAHPELAGQIVMPRTNIPNRAFLTAAKSMLAGATARTDLLLPFGLGDTLIPELTKAIEQFDAATSTAHSGRVGHVGARADLTAVTEECVALVGVLDGLMATRYNGDAENLAAWESARNVLGPFVKKSKEEAQAVTPAPAPGAEKAA
ncbi:MAG: hypothetical protein V4558_15925 [Gemmatimonadota bacterium]